MGVIPAFQGCRAAIGQRGVLDWRLGESGKFPRSSQRGTGQGSRKEGGTTDDGMSGPVATGPARAAEGTRVCARRRLRGSAARLLGTRKDAARRLSGNLAPTISALVGRPE